MIEAAKERGIIDTQASVSSHPIGKAEAKQIIQVPTRLDTTASFSPIPSFRLIKFLKLNRKENKSVRYTYVRQHSAITKL